MEDLVHPVVQFFAFFFLLLALAFVLIRLVQGPSTNDRVVALDLTGSIIMGFVLLYSMAAGDEIYFDVAMVISLVSFIGTVAISTYLKMK